MTSHSTVAAAPPGAWLRTVLGPLDRVITALLLLAVTAMVAVVSMQVGLRYGFNLSIDWADEVGRLAFVWSIFLAIPLGVRQGSHIGIDLLVDKLPGAARAALRRVAAVLGALMMFAITWASLRVAAEQWDELMATVDWSVGWFMVPVGLGAALSGLHLVHIAIAGPPAPQLVEAE